MVVIVIRPMPRIVKYTPQKTILLMSLITSVPPREGLQPQSGPPCTLYDILAPFFGEMSSGIRHLRVREWAVRDQRPMRRDSRSGTGATPRDEGAGRVAVEAAPSGGLAVVVFFAAFIGGSSVDGPRSEGTFSSGGPAVVTMSRAPAPGRTRCAVS